MSQIHHTTIIDWVLAAEAKLTEDKAAPPEIAELDELQTLIGSKKPKIWIWRALHHERPGILAITVGYRTSSTTPCYVVLLKIDRNVELFSPFAHALPTV